MLAAPLWAMAVLDDHVFTATGRTTTGTEAVIDAVLEAGTRAAPVDETPVSRAVFGITSLLATGVSVGKRIPSWIERLAPAGKPK